MIPLIILSNSEHAGKSFFLLGLGLNLKERGYKIGYFKPIGTIPYKIKEDFYVDEEAYFVSRLLEIEYPWEKISPILLTYEMEYKIINQSDAPDFEKLLDKVYQYFLKEKVDFLLIPWGNSFFEGISFGLNLKNLINKWKARAILIEPWKKFVSLDNLLGMKEELCECVLGEILNKVPPEEYLYVKEEIVPFIINKGLHILGVFQEVKELLSVSLREILEIINGGVVCCEDKLDEVVSNFLVGAMDPSEAFKYFLKTPEKAVITGVSRTDLQVLALETSTKCLILSGGLVPSETIVAKAKSKGIPIIVSTLDTFSIVNRIEKLIGKSIIKSKKKAEKAKEIIKSYFDWEKFFALCNKK